MPKKEIEFLDVDKIEWKPVEGVPGAYEKILNIDEDAESYTRLLKFEPGTETAETLKHDFGKEVYILKESLIDKSRGKTFIEGMYAYRPPGVVHRLYSVPFGCDTLEMRYYKKSIDYDFV